MKRSHRLIRRSAVVLAVAAIASTVAVATQDGVASASSPKVLYVGSVAGVTTPANATFTSIQAAVNAAKPGATILVAPGDYHESGDAGTTAGSSNVGNGNYGAVIIHTKNLTIRGMDRNNTIIDGTLSSASTPCSSAPGDQNTLGGVGRNGIVVYKAANVQISNLSVCNFLAGSGDAGNGVWWNGGANSALVGMKGYNGNYLTATSTYLSGTETATACVTCALYGIFASNASKGTLTNVYANNQADSGLYIGACQQVCDSVVNGAWMENNALGYSGTNSGGPMLFENSTFDNNREGFNTNIQLVGDPPPPQDGHCKGHSVNPVTTTESCWIFENNVVAYNNNPNVPVAGEAGVAPVGTGLAIEGGRNDTVMNNKFIGNEAWGVQFLPFPSSQTTNSALGLTCAGTGGVDGSSLGSALSCLYDPEGNHLVNNEFSGNGTLAGADGGDFGNLLVSGNELTNCFSGNTEWNSTFTTQTGAATDVNANDGFPAQTPASCGTNKKPTLTPTASLLGVNSDVTLLLAAECDAGLLCIGANPFPQYTATEMAPVPSTLPTMPNPCVGLAANAWCPGGVPVVTLRHLKAPKI